jgi:phosphatidylserine decarboxylase
MSMIHQYIDRCSGRTHTENLVADQWVHWLYGPVREKAPVVFKALISPRTTRWLGYLNYELPFHRRPLTIQKLVQELGIDLNECLVPPEELDSARKVFERRIRYWQCRPMSDDPLSVVAPADARVLMGSCDETRHFFLKEKFFSLPELLGGPRKHWPQCFADGDFAVFRLTPDKYHYNHAPVSGRVVDFFTIDGDCHSCNPAAVVADVTPFSKNRRVVTVIDTDVPHGTRVGTIAMVEIVALMIGDIVQCYSACRYDEPQAVAPGLFMHKGQPKSVFRPGSSVDVLFFQKGRLRFDEDLLANGCRQDVCSRFSSSFGRPLVETDVQVRSSIGRSLAAPGSSPWRTRTSNL